MSQLLRTLPTHEAPVLPKDQQPARPKFYLVGESEHSTALPVRNDVGPNAAARVQVSINGSWHAVRGRTMSFMQIVALTDPSYRQRGFQGATISFRRGAAARPTGLLQPGDTVPVTEGMLFNATITAAS